MEEQTYPELVRKLGKPGKDILSTLTPLRVNIWHMATGVCGESGELLDCYTKDYFDTENAIEELGDVCFYVEGLRGALNLKGPLTGKDRPTRSLYCSYDLTDPATDLSILCDDLLDMVKKIVVYNQKVEEHEAEIITLLWMISERVEQMGEELGVSFQEIIAANRRKLSKRYNGGYSDQAAYERRDKT